MIRIVRIAWLLFPLILLIVFSTFYHLAQDAPNGPLTTDYVQSEDMTQADPLGFRQSMIGFLKTADYLGGGISTAQLLWVGLPGLFLLWVVAPKPSFAEIIGAGVPTEKSEVDDGVKP